jgi:hypothetical protein
MLGKKYIARLDNDVIESLANRVVEILDKREEEKKQKKCTHATSLYPVTTWDEVIVKCGHCNKVWQ